MNKKIGCGLIIYVLFAFLLTGCGEKKEIQTAPFHSEEIPEFSKMIDNKDFDFYEIIGTTYRNGNSYIAVAGFTGEASQWMVYQMQEELSEIMTYEVQGESELNAFDVDSNGNLYLLEERYDEATDNFHKYLHIFDKEGNVLSEQNLEQWSGENDIVTNLKLGGNDEIYLFCESGRICVGNASAEFQYNIDAHEGEVILEANRMKDDSVIFVSAKYSGEKENLNVYQIQNENQSTKLIVELEEGKYDTNILLNGSEPYDFYLSNAQGVSGYSLNEKEMVPLMDWQANELVYSNIGHTCTLSEKVWLAYENGEQPNLVYVKQGEPKSQAEKETLRLACLQANSDIQEHISNFNKKNDTYYIELISYEGEVEPYQSFIMDLTTGKEMDIIVLPSKNQEMLFEKGVLEDLYPYIENDEELSKEDFLPNVLAAYEHNGKLYHTLSRIHISGWVMKNSYLAGQDTWNLDTFEQILEEHPDAQLFTRTSSEDILETFLNEMSGTFIRWEEGKCEFDSTVFYRMLELAKEKGKENSDIPIDEMVQCLREEQLLFSETYITPNEIALYDAALDGEFSVVGNPFSDNTGRVFDAWDVQCGIVATSDNKDGAWEFVRNYLTKEYQDFGEDVIMFGDVMDGIPIRKDCFEEYVKRFTATEAYEKDGQWIEPIDGSSNNNGFQYTVSPMTTEQEKLFRDMVTTTTQKLKTDEQINQIIFDEAEAYFKGKKTLDETVEIIQNRVSTYMSENR